MKSLAAFSALALVAAASSTTARTSQPYAGFEARPIKALSDAQIADLKAGRGMGLALVAELNGYPGPIHVLELDADLNLSATQRSKVRELFAAMQAETVPLGKRLIAQEADLDRQFARKTITQADLTAATQAIGATQAELRAAHLKYHLATIAVLEPVQVQRYAELRGYAGGEHAQHQHSAHQH